MLRRFVEKKLSAVIQRPACGRVLDCARLCRQRFLFSRHRVHWLYLDSFLSQKGRERLVEGSDAVVGGNGVADRIVLLRGARAVVCVQEVLFSDRL